MEEKIEQVESVEQEQVEEVVEVTVEEAVEPKVYTQEEVDELQAQIDELSKYKPIEKSDKEIELEQRAKEIWSREVSISLKENGLDAFAEFIKVEFGNVDELDSKITKLKSIIGGLELSNSYQPSNHKPVDAYLIAKKQKDSKAMIKAKL